VFDHVGIWVSDRETSERLYETALRTLGIETSYRTNEWSEWDDLALGQSGDEHPVTTGLHVGFVAPSREQVDAFWQAGVDLGYRSDGEPGPRPQYVEDYYGGFLRDADGNSIEACHFEGTRRGGIIDHVWVRVADLAASVAFYDIVAAAAGHEIRRSPDRVTYDDGSGGSLSILAGEPTRNVHIAFPGDEETVRRFHADLIAAGYRDHGEPAERPRYHPGYYAAYVLDPDGNNIEIVDHHR
jgi:catechol 2,3-dioxygenase-like lactoylglutathione lyase family enzyme